MHRAWVHQFSDIWRRRIDHNLNSLTAVALFKNYFDKIPPFDKDGSKEFPDAASIMLLEQWSLRNNSRIYVITSDAAVGRAVQRSERLILVESIELFLEIYNKIKDKRGVGIVQRYLIGDNVVDSVIESFNSNWGSIEIDYWGDAKEGKIDNIIVDSVESVHQATVISLGNTQAEAIVDVGLRLKVDVLYKEDDDSDGVGFLGSAYDGRIKETHVEKIKFLIRLNINNGDVDDANILTRYLIIS